MTAVRVRTSVTTLIAQLLNREFLLGLAQQARTDIQRELAQRQSPRRSAKSSLEPLDNAELRGIAAALGSIEEQPESLTEPTRDVNAAPDELPANNIRPKEDFAFVPRDPLLSLLQTTLDDYFESEHPEVIEEHRMLDDRRGTAPEPAVTDRRLKGVELRWTVDGRRLWKRFEVANPKVLSDPRWAWCLLAMAWRDVHGYAQFVDSPPVIEIENEARIFLLGDWGSGLPRAQKVASQVRAELAKGGRRQQHVIHLGDVYYSGSKREYEHRFLNYWPVDEGASVASYSLNGNHDMYTGGHSYFDVCLGDPRFARQSGCSFFALRNDYWQFVALDTSYEDGGLHGRQAQWARDLIETTPATTKTALLSHHQLFSAHEPGAAKLGRKIQPVLATGRVDAWFWGHEHRCIAYMPTTWEGARVGFTSCIGHGGIPEYLAMKQGETRPRPWLYEYLQQYGDGWEPWDTFGFCVLELSSDRIKARYIDEDGKEHYFVPDIGQVSS